MQIYFKNTDRASFKPEWAMGTAQSLIMLNAVRRIVTSMEVTEV